MNKNLGENTIIINNQEEIDLKKIFLTYFSHWKYFILTVILFLIMAFMYLRYTSPLYLVTTTILLDDKESGGLSSEMSAFKDLSLAGGKKKSVINEIGVLKSRSLLESVIKEKRLNVSFFTKGKINNLEIYKNEVPFKINFFEIDSILNNLDTTFVITPVSKSTFLLSSQDGLISKKVEFGKNELTDFGQINVIPMIPDEVRINETTFVQVSTLSDMTDYYRNKINVEPEALKSSLLIISLTDPVREKAEDILNGLVDNYNKNGIRYKNLITENTDKFINDRINKISQDLASVDRGVEEFKTKNKLTDMEFESNLVLESNSELQNKIVDLNSQIKLVEYVKSYIDMNETDLIPSNLGIRDEATNENTLIFNRLLMERNRVIVNSSEINPTILNLDTQLKS